MMGFRLTGYQLFLICLFVSWPVLIGAALLFMGRLERLVGKAEASTPEEAGLENGTSEKEVKIVFGDQIVGEPEPRHNEPRPGQIAGHAES
jgi:hypothetical protein